MVFIININKKICSYYYYYIIAIWANDANHLREKNYLIIFDNVFLITYFEINFKFVTHHEQLRKIWAHLLIHKYFQNKIIK